MKKLTLLLAAISIHLCTSAPASAAPAASGPAATPESAQDVSGTITLAKGLQAPPPNSVLFVFAKKAGMAAGNGMMPVAVLRAPNPKFPFEFRLSAANVMAPGTPFEGPFSIYARLSPTGDAMDKSGPQGTTKSSEPVTMGAKNLKIELKR